MEKKEGALPSRKLCFGLLGLSALLILVDQWTKSLVLARLRPLGRFTVIDGLLELQYLENPGAAFGFFQNAPLFIGAFTAIASAVIAVMLFRYRQHDFFSCTAACLLIAGGLGNLIDRFLYGFVVDFIHVLFFGYIFNFADCCVTVGACMLVLHAVRLALKERPSP